MSRPSDSSTPPQASAAFEALEAEAEAAGRADPEARLEWHRMSRLERERIMRDASAFRAAHDRRVAELGPLARAAHEDACILCVEEEGARAAA